jgi:hypothetical protein
MGFPLFVTGKPSAARLRRETMGFPLLVTGEPERSEVTEGNHGFPSVRVSGRGFSGRLAPEVYAAARAAVRREVMRP